MNEIKKGGLGLGNVFTKVDTQYQEPKAHEDVISKETTVQVPKVEPKVPEPVLPETQHREPEQVPLPKNMKGISEETFLKFAETLGRSIVEGNRTIPQHVPQPVTPVLDRTTARVRTMEGSKKYRANSKKITSSKYLREPYTFMQIPLGSPLLPKSPNDPVQNAKLAVWEYSVNLVTFKIPAGKQVLVPLPIYKQYQLRLLSKTKGKAAYEQFQEMQRLLNTDDFYKSQGLRLFDAQGKDWATSVMNPNSRSYNEAECYKIVESMLR